jgi:hypothetical protein
MIEPPAINSSTISSQTLSSFATRVAFETFPTRNHKIWGPESRDFIKTKSESFETTIALKSFARENISSSVAY